MRIVLPHRLKGPQRLLWTLGGFATLSVLLLAWIGWDLMQREARAVAARALADLERSADLVVHGVTTRITECERALAAMAAEGAVTGDACAPGLVVLATPDRIETRGEPRLLFRPMPPPHDGLPAQFDSVDEAEFRTRDASRAVALLTPLARDADAAVRGLALLRMGRILRARGASNEAVAAYRQLASLEATIVSGMPGGVAGRIGELEVLSKTGDRAAAARVASDLMTGLQQGRWPLTEAQYEHFASVVSRALPRAAEFPPSAIAASRWVQGLLERGPDGQRHGGADIIDASDGALLARWHRAAPATAVWVAGAGLVAEVAARHRVVVNILPAGTASLAQASASQAVTRLPLSTGLPWALRVHGTVVDNGRSLRLPLLLSGLALLLSLVVIGMWSAARALQREAALARAQSEFVANVSHEFRTPLAAIRQLSELLATGRVINDARRQEYYGSLVTESGRLQHLVETLLDFGRIEAGPGTLRKQPVSLAALASRVFEEFHARRPARALELKPGPDGARILADPDALAVALHNLLDNAAKYSPDTSAIEMAWATEAGRAFISVRDHGEGIAPHERATIFDRFSRGSSAATRQVRGTGIGLALVREVVQRHDGELALDSAPGVGSTFTVWLPLAPDTRELRP